MGKVDRLKKPDRLISAQPSETEGGRVLIFTGVRYERQSETDTEKRPTPSGKRKSKRS